MYVARVCSSCSKRNRAVYGKYSNKVLLEQASEDIKKSRLK